MGFLPSRKIRRDRVPRDPHVEVEVRFRLGGSDNALSCLRDGGIRFRKPERQDDQAYAPAAWSYDEPRIGVTFARLRTTKSTHLFTVKRPVTDVRTCIEHECIVSDRFAMHESILLMGFLPTIRIVKTRAMAQHGPFTLCLDEVEGLGRFLEIERLAGPGEDTDGARIEMQALLHTLGIRAEPCDDTYDALLHAGSSGFVDRVAAAAA